MLFLKHLHQHSFYIHKAKTYNLLISLENSISVINFGWRRMLHDWMHAMPRVSFYISRECFKNIMCKLVMCPFIETTASRVDHPYIYMQSTKAYFRYTTTYVNKIQYIATWNHIYMSFMQSPVTSSTILCWLPLRACMSSQGN